MLTKISAVTGAVSAVVSALILFDVLTWTDTQLAAVNLAIVAVGGLIHTLLNPAVPWVGISE